MVLADNKSFGIDTRWKAGRKTYFRDGQSWFDDINPSQMNELAYYAATGTYQSEPSGVDWAVYRKWERQISLTLSGYALLSAFDLEKKALFEQRFDYEAAARVYAAVRLAQMIDLHVHVKAMERLGEQLSTLDVQMLPSIALGVIIGDPSALQLWRLLCVACRQGWYTFDVPYPVYHFLLLLMADFLGEALTLGSQPLPEDTPLSALLQEWDNPQADALVPLCMAACDFHTTRCRTGTYMDFAGMNWRYMPVEIMLLMRLRSLRGLENPQFEHPLWTDVFANVTAGSAIQADELIERVEERMRADGYDEAFVIRGVLAA